MLAGRRGHMQGVAVRAPLQQPRSPAWPTAGPWPDAGRADCSIEQLLRRARLGLERVPASAVPRALERGALLVDIRDGVQRERDGVVADALHIARNVLEWRCAPDSPWRLAEVSDPRRRLILMCDEGYQSSLAACALQRMGLPLATDVIGGFQAWRSAGLPVDGAG